jgi:SAM-dependent methyltransferase
MRWSEHLPEAIPGLAASFYSALPGRLARPAQHRLAEAVDAVLPGEARLVLDVGCGPGWLAIALADRRPRLHVVAVDLSPAMVRICRRHARGRANLDIRCEHAAALSLPDEAVDMIVSSEAMHHWRAPVAILDEFHRVLRPGGRAWIFDGRSDFTPRELAGFTPCGERTPPAPARWLLRCVLTVHGFSAADWRDYVPELVRRSRFGAGRIEPHGMYRRLELVKAARSQERRS